MTSFVVIAVRPGNNSQLSCSLACSLENFCEKCVIYQGKMKNFRRKYKILEESAMILIFPTEIKKK